MKPGLKKLPDEFFNNFVSNIGRILWPASICCFMAGCATSDWERWKPFDEAKSAGDYTKALAIAKSERDRNPLPEKSVPESWDDIEKYFQATEKIIEAHLGDAYIGAYWKENKNRDCAAVTREYRAAVNDLDRIAAQYYIDRMVVHHGFRYKADQIAQCIYETGGPDKLTLITRIYLSTIQPTDRPDYQYEARTESYKPLMAALKDSGDLKGARQVAAYEAVIRPKQAKMISDFSTAVDTQFKGSADFWGRSSVKFAGEANIYSQVGDGLKKAGYTFYQIAYEQSAGNDRFWAENNQKRSEKARESQASADAWNSALLSAAGQINALNLAQPVRAGAAGQWQTMSNNMNTIMLQSLTTQQNQVAASRTQAPVADLIRDALKDYEATNR